MDLISRKAVKEEIKDEWDGSCSEYGPKQIINDTLCAVDRIPTVPAVPLDKLCEWLADQIHASVDCGIDHCDNCDAYDGTLSVKGCWMKLIKEQVMEEHNGTDNP